MARLQLRLVELSYSLSLFAAQRQGFSTINMIQTGIYLHYKNLRYEVLGCVRHSESLEWLVLYKALYGEQGLWVRPLAMFTEQVVVNGIEQPRFKRIEVSE